MRVEMAIALTLRLAHSAFSFSKRAVAMEELYTLTSW
jgi:hypothetical protein